jgi:hypothetical protein
MKKRVNDKISAGNDTKNKKPKNKGPTQNGNKRISNIHRH